MVTTTTSPRRASARAVVDRLRARADRERPAVDPDEHRPARAARGGRVDVQVEAVLALRADVHAGQRQPIVERVLRRRRPERCASRTPAQGAAGSGARKRSAPIGGCANGMPRKEWTPPSLRPSSRPDAISTRGSDCRATRTSRFAAGPRRVHRVDHAHVLDPVARVARHRLPRRARAPRMRGAGRCRWRRRARARATSPPVLTRMSGGRECGASGFSTRISPRLPSRARGSRAARAEKSRQ